MLPVATAARFTGHALLISRCYVATRHSARWRYAMICCRFTFDYCLLLFAILPPRVFRWRYADDAVTPIFRRRC